MFPSRVLVGFFKSSLNVDCKQHVTGVCVTLYSVSQKIPPTVFWNFFPNGWEFLINIYTPIVQSFLH